MRDVAKQNRNYETIQDTLNFQDYHNLRKKAKTSIKNILLAWPGYSRAQLTRLIHQHRTTGKIIDRRVNE